MRSDARQLREQGATAFVLDLRGNPGGLLDEAVELSAIFLDEGSPVVNDPGAQRGGAHPVGPSRGRRLTTSLLW